MLQRGQKKGSAGTRPVVAQHRVTYPLESIENLFVIPDAISEIASCTPPACLPGKCRWVTAWWRSGYENYPQRYKTSTLRGRRVEVYS